MKAAILAMLMLAGLPVHADAPGYDPAIVAHIVRAGQINATLMEAEKNGEFSIVMKRDGTSHRYVITRTLSGNDALCYKHVAWPGSADKCEFRAEMAARLARDWTIFVR